MTYCWALARLARQTFHVSGKGVVGADRSLVDHQTELAHLKYEIHLMMMMAAALTIGFKFYAAVIEQSEMYAEAVPLEDRLTELTMRYRNPANI